MIFSSCVKVAAFLFILLSPSISQIKGDLKVAFIRVSFPPGDFPGYTGSGNYNYSQKNICSEYTVDPAPHDKNYFQSHIVSVDNYFKTVSYGSFGLDTIASKIFPKSDTASYLIQKPMNYYNQLGYESEHEKRITELLKDALDVAYAEDKISFDNFDLVAIIHPGVGQDFSLPFLDPTPEDIPSTYIDSSMIISHLGGPITFGTSRVTKGIILPESQNQPLMDEDIYNALSSPCDIQFSITGTWSMMIGFAAGLPPLWDLKTGQSGVGIYGLMDQGSNNARGIIPAPPDAWTRIYAKWEEPTIYKSQQKIILESGVAGNIAKIPINDHEYFLIENRTNWFRPEVSFDSARFSAWEQTDQYPDLINILIDSAQIKKDANGVINRIENYNLGLPNSGLLIWHIDENIIKEGLGKFSINKNKEFRGIDLEEADGAQDIGYISNLFTDPSSGYWGDMWFMGNGEYFRANASDKISFSSLTNPSTISNSGGNTGINITDISKPGYKMSFSLRSNFEIDFINHRNKYIQFQWDIDSDGALEFIGGGDSLWWGKNLKNINTFSETLNNDTELLIAQNTDITALVSMEKVGLDYTFTWFDYKKEPIDNFIKTWQQSISSNSSMALLRADGLNKSIEFLKDSIFFIISSDSTYLLNLDSINYSYKSNYITNVHLYDDRISINDTSFKYGKFQSITLIDLEKDGISDIVALDDDGSIHAFDHSFNYKNGFPVNARSENKILAMDLIGDEMPELIFESNGLIQIFNNEGVLVESISAGGKGSLQSLGVYNDKKIIITKDRIIKTKNHFDSSGDRLNEWLHKYATPDFSRFIDIEKIKNINNNFIFYDESTYAYPNPSYGERITFRIKIGKAKSIKIKIFDIAGLIINTLTLDNLSEFSPYSNLLNLSHDFGIYELYWDVSNIESGIYLANLSATNGKQSKNKIIKVGIIK